jgi:hypothetical protein
MREVVLGTSTVRGAAGAHTYYLKSSFFKDLRRIKGSRIQRRSQRFPPQACRAAQPIQHELLCRPLEFGGSLPRCWRNDGISRKRSPESVRRFEEHLADQADGSE